MPALSLTAQLHLISQSPRQEESQELSLRASNQTSRQEASQDLPYGQRGGSAPNSLPILHEKIYALLLSCGLIEADSQAVSAICPVPFGEVLLHESLPDKVRDEDCQNKVSRDETARNRDKRPSVDNKSILSPKKEKRRNLVDDFADRIHAIASESRIVRRPNARKPLNLDELKHELSQRRGSPEPDSKNIEDIQNNILSTSIYANRRDILSSNLLKHYETSSSSYRITLNSKFDASPEHLPFSDRLLAPDPDFLQGFTAAAFDRAFGNLELLELWNQAAVPVKESSHPRHTIALAHFAGEWANAMKDMGSAEILAAYDGVCLLHAIDKALAYMEDSENNLGSETDDTLGPVRTKKYLPEVFTFTCDGESLRIWVHYSVRLPDVETTYHQYLLHETSLTKGVEEFQDGRRYLRNAQDRARTNAKNLMTDLEEFQERQLDFEEKEAKKKIDLVKRSLCKGQVRSYKPAVATPSDEEETLRPAKKRKCARDGRAESMPMSSGPWRYE